ncbi:uncharacterized protein LOC125648456 [Ostrea edulis]|uniref:uncharacterized protein LOC125648456 n=1 Tax=Ostrea edulis TaxID=37623 RepID=UPI0024AF4A46|nr:uncharacterized protein LOC125648456 [Ostrea edulis]
MRRWRHRDVPLFFFAFMIFLLMISIWSNSSAWNIPKSIPLRITSTHPNNISPQNFLSWMFSRTSGDWTYGKISSSNLTIVTAYWNIGTFKKGPSALLTKNTYFSWMKTFQYLMNPLVVYTDSKEFGDLMKKLRSEGKLNYQTEIFYEERKSFWPFGLVDRIQSVYKQPGYPAHHPNTVNALYAAAQHTKFAVVADAARKNIYNTPYYAWLDVGYFRDLVGSEQFFELKIPNDQDPGRISVNLIFRRHMEINPYEIFRHNKVWVGGGMFIGTKHIFIKFEELYRKALLYFLDQHLMNSDQQVLFAMYSNQGRKALKPQTELKLYTPKGNGNPWFYLGYLCREIVNRANVIEFI